MAAKRFSEFIPIPLGQKMKVVGLFGVENTISEEQVYLLSQEEFVQVQEDAAGFLVNNGTAPILRSNGNNFTISEVTLIAEQVTTQTSISEK